mgnify:CR=1 FL=1
MGKRELFDLGSGHRWKAHEIGRARSLKAKGMLFADIAKALGPGFTATMVQCKLRYVERIPGQIRTEYPRHIELTPDMLRDRETRIATPRTLTQTIMGDPPDGYSALDRWGR